MFISILARTDVFWRILFKICIQCLSCGEFQQQTCIENFPRSREKYGGTEAEGGENRGTETDRRGKPAEWVILGFTQEPRGHSCLIDQWIDLDIISHQPSDQVNSEHLVVSSWLDLKLIPRDEGGNRNKSTRVSVIWGIFFTSESSVCEHIRLPAQVPGCKLQYCLQRMMPNLEAFSYMHIGEHLSPL